MARIHRMSRKRSAVPHFNCKRTSAHINYVVKKFIYQNQSPLECRFKHSIPVTQPPCLCHRHAVQQIYVNGPAILNDRDISFPHTLHESCRISLSPKTDVAAAFGQNHPYSLHYQSYCFSLTQSSLAPHKLCGPRPLERHHASPSSLHKHPGYAHWQGAQ